MARPFRHHPPDLADDLALRTDVQSALAGRFDRRVTVVVAGAGFGKTTALTQAFAENALRPLGTDLWLGCQMGDSDPSFFAAGLSTSCGLDRIDDADQVIDAISNKVASMSPTSVAIVLDDVQFLANSPSVMLIGDLIEQLPANGHLVLASRSLPDVAITRLQLIGECVVIDETALALDASDAARWLGSERAVDVERFGGWPALVRLSRDGVPARFVYEEVVALLDDHQLDVLRALVAIGEADTEMLDGLVPHEEGASASALAAVPLVHRRGEQWGAHDLWAELLGTEGGDRIRHRAAMLALTRDDATWAVDTMLRCDLGHQTSEPSDVGRVAGRKLLERSLRDALIRADRMPPSVLRRWVAQLDHLAPTPAHDVDSVHPARTLLAGLVTRLDNPGSDTCHELLRRAATGFERLGDADAEVAALGALVYAFHVRRDLDGLRWAFDRLTDLAGQGVASAAPFPLLAGALLATSAGDPARVVEFTEPLLDFVLPVELRAVSLWLHANALGNLGRRAVEPAEECARLGLPLPGMAMIHSGSRWRAGLIREMQTSPVEPLDGDRDRFLMSTWECCLAATTGDLATARRHLDVIETSLSNASQWQTSGSVEVPKATVLLAEGRDDEAADVMRRFIAQNPPEGQAVFYRLFAMGLVYLLVPDERAWFHERAQLDGFGPLYQRDLDLVTAFVEVTENRELEVIRSLAFPDGAEALIPALGVRNGATLLAAGVAAGRTDLDVLIEDFVDLLGEAARIRWRELADGSDDLVARGARSIIESTPVAPANPPLVVMLGGSDLIIDGAVTAHPDWRRERVRALLAFMVLHPDTTRDVVMSALWPDAPADSARRSLRSTLNMLLAVLEPNRLGGDASSFVRSSGQRLRLLLDIDTDHAGDDRRGAGLRVDVQQFEAWLDEAERLERSGLSSLAIDAYQSAFTTYDGDLLVDSYDEWVLQARDRLRARFVGGAVRLGELRLATGTPSLAIDAATRAISTEPWCEPGYRLLAAAHLDAGDVAAARRSLDACDAALVEFGGVREPQTLEIRRRLARR